MRILWEFCPGKMKNRTESYGFSESMRISTNNY